MSSSRSYDDYLAESLPAGSKAWQQRFSRWAAAKSQGDLKGAGKDNGSYINQLHIDGPKSYSHEKVIKGHGVAGKKGLDKDQGKIQGYEHTATIGDSDKAAVAPPKDEPMARQQRLAAGVVRSASHKTHSAKPKSAEVQTWSQAEWDLWNQRPQLDWYWHGTSVSSWRSWQI